MFEPSLTSQLLGVGAIAIGCFVAGFVTCLMDVKKEETAASEDSGDPRLTRGIHTRSESECLGRSSKRPQKISFRQRLEREQCLVKNKNGSESSRKKSNAYELSNESISNF